MEETVHTRGKRKEKPWRKKGAALRIGRDAHRSPATIPRASIPRKALLRKDFTKEWLEPACINENGGGLDSGSFAKDAYIVEKQRTDAGQGVDISMEYVWKRWVGRMFCRRMLEMLSDNMKLDARIAKVNAEIVLVSGLVNGCVHENAEKAQSQEAFNKHYCSLVDRHQKAIERLEKLKAARMDKAMRQMALRNHIDALTTAPLVVDAWDERLWRQLLVKGVVGRDGSIEFEFRGGERVPINTHTSS